MSQVDYGESGQPPTPGTADPRRPQNPQRVQIPGIPANPQTAQADPAQVLAERVPGGGINGQNTGGYQTYGGGSAAPDVDAYRAQAAQQGIKVDQGDAEVLARIAREGWQGGQIEAPQTAAGYTNGYSGSNLNGSYTDNLSTIQNGDRNKALYEMLLARAQQSTNINRRDPIIRAQADAYAANEERSKRAYLNDAAEGSGPLTNLRGERRMANERVGQRTGAMESQLMGNELMARRQEIAGALSQMGGMLTSDQQLALQRELGLLDNAIKQQGIGIQQGQLDLGFGDLGLRAQQQASYWDWIRRGGNIG